MELSPYLLFNGQCAAAFRFYEQTLGGTIVMMQTHGESPMKDQVQTFWSAGFGMAVDRFGIPWMVNSEQSA